MVERGEEMKDKQKERERDVSVSPSMSSVQVCQWEGERASSHIPVCQSPATRTHISQTGA